MLVGLPVNGRRMPCGMRTPRLAWWMGAMLIITAAICGLPSPAAAQDAIVLDCCLPDRRARCAQPRLLSHMGSVQGWG